MPSVMRQLEDGEPVWFGDGLRFSCTQCGNCCTGPPGFVWFSPEEGKAIADHLGLSVDQFKRRYTTKKHGRLSLGEVERAGLYDCVFLERQDDGRMTCSIYEVRPTQCRTWPFWPSNLKSEKAWRRAATDCPGMAQGGAANSGATGTFVPVERVRVLVKQNPKGL